MPRKSTASTAAATDANGDISMASEGAAGHASPKQQSERPEKADKATSKPKSKDDAMTIDDLLLPKSIIQRIAKGELPANTSIQKDAVLALTKSATVFISLLASAANEMTDRKTIQSQDVIKALRDIEMDGVMGMGVLGPDGKRGGRVEREIEKWESETRGKRKGYRDKVKARESQGGTGDTTIGTVDTQVDEDEEEKEEEDRSKRPRIEDEGVARSGSTGPITHKTSTLKLNTEHGNSDDGEDMDEGEGGEDDDDQGESDEQDDEEEEEDEQEADETQDIEDAADAEDDSRGKVGTLAPDGRVEIEASDDESD